MTQIFVDTSAFTALADKNDDNHAKAVGFSKTISRVRLVTTNYVLDELYTLLLLHTGYGKTVATQTWQIFEEFNTDKQWSFTDCASYVVMKAQGIAKAFTYV